ncbi:MAG: thioredoxin domain-containing protein [Acidobacteriota bacterium]
MHRLYRPALVLAIGLLLGCLGSTTADAEPENSDARKDKILANLVLQFPQLERLNPTMGDLEATSYDGLEKGTFVVQGRPQVFLVSSDDSELYLVSGEPIDVSKTSDQIAEEQAKRKADEAQQAEERMAQIEKAIEGEPVRGNAQAPVTIVEFSDFQCPYCARGADTMEQVLEKYENDVKFVFMHFPLGFHPWAKPAAIAAECAGNQSDDAFWLLHDKYFADQKALNPENVVAKSREYLAGTSIDMDVWATCAENTESDEYKAAAATVDEEMKLGQELGVTGTPGFFVNGTFLNGAQPLEQFVPLIEAAKAEG